MKTARILLVALTLLLVVGLVGCQAVADKAAEEAAEEIIGAATGTEVETSGEGENGEVTITGKDGEELTMSGSETGLPKDFPEDDAPVYDADFEGSSMLADETSQSFYVNQVSEDDWADVVDWFLTEYEDAGWTKTGDMQAESEGESSAVLTFEKGEGETATIAISEKTEGGIDISYIVVVPKG